MIRSVIRDWAKQYVPILINSICTAICLALAGCQLKADKLSVKIDYPASYHSPTNSLR